MSNENVYKNEYAIVLLKDKSIVQVRIYNVNVDKVIEHAKAFNKTKTNWYDNAVVVKTVDHIKDLTKNKQK